MNRAVLSASWFAVRRAGLLVPAAAAVFLVAGTAHVQDDGHAIQVLRGVGVLLACAWVATMDDPSGEVVAASPYPRHERSLMRATAGAFVVLPVWVLAATVAELSFDPTPVWGLSLEALAMGVGGLAIGAGLRAWTVHYSASYLAVIGVVVLAIGTNAMPRGWAMVQGQSWGPPWEAAQIRWAALLLLVVGVFAAAVRDPMSSPGSNRSRVNPLAAPGAAAANREPEFAEPVARAGSSTA